MAGPGPLTITALGAVTTPTTLNVSVGSAMSVTMKDWGTFDSIAIPSLRAVVLSHGEEPMRLVIEGASYILGPRSPSAAPTVASTAVRASSVLTITTTPNDGDLLYVGLAGAVSFMGIVFKTTLDTSSFTAQVLIGGSKDNAAANFKKLINGTGTNGTEYFDGFQVFFNGSYSQTYWQDAHQVEVSANTTGGNPTVTIRATIFGTGGNTLKSSVITGGARMSFSSDPLMTGGTAGTGTDPGSGFYTYARAYFRSADGAMSGISPVTTLEQDSNCNVNLTNFTAPATRDGSDFHRIIRSTTIGEALYRVADFAVGTGEPFVDSVSDDVLTGDFQQVFDPTTFRPYTSGYPTVGKYLAYFNGQVFTGGVVGSADYSVGTASVTTASTSVTLSSSARPRENWIGRVFQVTGDSIGYLIEDVDESTRVLTLALPYNGTTAGSASYTVKDKRDSCGLNYTPPFLPNNFPPLYSLGGVTSEDPRGLTGLATAWNAVVPLTRTGLWRINQSNDVTFDVQPIGEGMGCIGGQSLLNVKGRLYWIGPDGVWEWDGSGDPVPLSRPSGRDAEGIHETVKRINLDQGDLVVSDYNPSEQVIRWAVPLDGADWNTHIIVYDLQTGFFYVDNVEWVTSLRSAPGLDGVCRTFMGDAFGGLFILDVSTSDGAYEFEPSQTVSSYASTTRVVTVTGTALPTTGDGLKGVPFIHVAADGTMQRGKIVSNTSSTFTAASPISTSPTAGDTVVVGGIAWAIQSWPWDLDSPEVYKSVESLRLDFVKQSLAGQVWCACAVDGGTLSILARSGLPTDSADLSRDSGEYPFMLQRGKARRVTLRLFAVSPGVEVQVQGFALAIRVPQSGDEAA